MFEEKIKPYSLLAVPKAVDAAVVIY